MYSDQVANDYHLADAFHWTGLRLYGPEWTGNEYQGRKAEDRALSEENLQAKTGRKTPAFRQQDYATQLMKPRVQF